MSVSPAPVFRLYLLRHAKAGWTQPGETDFDRALDETGHREALTTGRMAAQASFMPDRILSSSAVRCRQTAAAFRDATGIATQILHLDALYNGTADAYRGLIAEHAEESSMLIVGHNPVIEELMSDIIGDRAAADAMPFGYPPGVLAAIDLESRPEPGILPPGRLIAWLDPDCHGR